MAEKVFALFAPWYSRWASRQWSKRQPGIKWQKKGRKNFRALCAMVSEVGNGQQWWSGRKRAARQKKRRPGKKKAEKGPKKFSRFMRHGTRGDQVKKKEARQKQAARQKKRRPGRKKGGQEKNGRKRAEKFFALYAPFPYYYCIMPSQQQLNK